jgi:hypothetical protein
MKTPSILPCECDDGTCFQCKIIMDLNEAIRKTSTIYYNYDGSIKGIIPTEIDMAFRRIMRKK